MSLSKKALQAFADAYKGDDLPSALVDAIADAYHTKQRILQIDACIRKQEQEHKAVIKDLSDKRRKVQSECRHLDTTYYGDPSGGSDSYTGCNVCGAELPRRASR